MSLPRPLVERFFRHLAEMRDEVAGLEAAIASGGDNREPLRAAAHKLAGTAGAFGFPIVGENARQVEEAVLANAPWEPTLAHRVGALRASLAEAIREGCP